MATSKGHCSVGSWVCRLEFEKNLDGYLGIKLGMTAEDQANGQELWISKCSSKLRVLLRCSKSQHWGQEGVSMPPTPMSTRSEDQASVDNSISSASRQRV